MEQPIIDYLTKQVYIDRNVVTYRSLSRHFNIHVNLAKNNLATFHSHARDTPESVYATYMLTGEVAPPSGEVSKGGDEGMDVDENADEPAPPNQDEEPESEVVAVIKVLLVGEKDVQSAKMQYRRIFSQHVYSLSPTHLVDSALICTPSEKVYEADAKIKADASTLLGRIVGPDVHVGKPVPLAPLPAEASGPSTATTAAKAATPAKVEPTEEKPRLRPKEKVDKPTLKPRASGILDWGKAKTKQDKANEEEERARGKKKEKAGGKGKLMEEEEEEEEEEDEEEARSKETEGKAKAKEKVKVGVKEEAKAKVAGKGREKETAREETGRIPAPSDAKHERKETSEQKRGTKRKSVLPQSSDEEDEKTTSPPRSKNPVVAAKKGVPGFFKPAAPKRPTNRRRHTRALMTDTEDEDTEPAAPPPPPAVKSRGQTKKKAIPSSSDSDEDTKPKARTKGKAVDKSLRAMMDIDDDEVIKVSRPPSVPLTESEGVDESQVDADDFEFVEDSEPERARQRPRRERKEKKPVPVGRNGLKKRRVLKTRTRTDEKGYTVVEDYSSYESVDEEEPEPEETGRAKGKGGAASRGKNRAAGDEDTRPVAKDESKGSSKPAKARKSTGKAGKGTLMNFFGGKPK